MSFDFVGLDGGEVVLPSPSPTACAAKRAPPGRRTACAARRSCRPAPASPARALPRVEATQHADVRLQHADRGRLGVERHLLGRAEVGAHADDDARHRRSSAGPPAARTDPRTTACRARATVPRRGECRPGCGRCCSRRRTGSPRGTVRRASSITSRLASCTLAAFTPDASACSSRARTLALSSYLSRLAITGRRVR